MKTSCRGSSRLACLPHLGGMRHSPPSAPSLQAVELGYRDNPYHNAAHAADVVQTLGCMLLTEEFRASLTAMELLAMLVGACCHDVGHPGSRWEPVSRPSQCKTDQPFALWFICKRCVRSPPRICVSEHMIMWSANLESASSALRQTHLRWAGKACMRPILTPARAPCGQ